MERCLRHGRWGSNGFGCAENVSYGKTDAEMIVLQLFVDDGVPDRGHRKTLQNATFKVTGLATGMHK
jgi:uncharacterized protein YkwD